MRAAGCGPGRAAPLRSLLVPAAQGGDGEGELSEDPDLPQPRLFYYSTILTHFLPLTETLFMFLLIAEPIKLQSCSLQLYSWAILFN